MYGNLKSFYIPFVHITHAELSKNSAVSGLL